MKLALSRLDKEQDIQYLIEMNRVSRFLHKATFLTRQRLAINYSHKYVISDTDLRRASRSKSEQNPAKDDMVKNVIEEFDPIAHL